MRASTVRRATTVGNTMRAWMTENYKGPLVCREVSIPSITQPNQVLIKVKATSMNPIDCRMTEGYGDQILSTWSHFESFTFQRPSRLPLIAGRDCCGEVIAVGGNVTGVNVGDEVIAVVPGPWSGSHAEYVLTKSDAVAKKPLNVNYLEASTLPYVACTSWAALVSVARINPNNASGIRVLIHGGSGGIGSAAIQMLKAWGAEKVVATCSENNMNYVTSLGGIAVDYNSQDVKDQLIAEGPFDVILDCVDTDLARWSDKVMGVWRNSVHVSIVSPMLKDTDRYGIPFGLLSTAIKYFERSCGSIGNGRWFSYAYFMPNSQCLNQISEFIDNGKIKIPHIEKIYKFNEFPTAYDRCALLHTKGKLIIDIAEESLPPKIDSPPLSPTLSPYHPGTQSVPVIDLKPPPISTEPPPVIV
jgi:NADPH:quinone reductase-like Zn-dependent oxidoreductase